MGQHSKCRSCKHCTKKALWVRMFHRWHWFQAIERIPQQRLTFSPRQSLSASERMWHPMLKAWDGLILCSFDCFRVQHANRSGVWPSWSVNSTWKPKAIKGYRRNIGKLANTSKRTLFGLWLPIRQAAAFANQYSLEPVQITASSGQISP